VNPPWENAWFKSEVKAASGLLWRGVEAQHRVATMRLVDSLDEQAELERLLEASKPPLPRAAVNSRASTRPQHYLLSTPFRYRSPHPSRFRVGGDPGLWYGAKERDTACTEVAYWRWRFLMDSAGLRGGELVTEHTLFQAQVRGSAKAARGHGVQWIRYASARRPGGHCAAVLAPECLSLPEPARVETWLCKVTAAQALMLHDEDRLTVALGG